MVVDASGASWALKAPSGWRFKDHDSSQGVEVVLDAGRSEPLILLADWAMDDVDPCIVVVLAEATAEPFEEELREAVIGGLSETGSGWLLDLQECEIGDFWGIYYVVCFSCEGALLLGVRWRLSNGHTFLKVDGTCALLDAPGLLAAMADIFGIFSRSGELNE